MSKFLINTSNLKTGGGLQVAESICRLLYKYSQHIFYVVLSDKLYYLSSELSLYNNIKVIKYTQSLSIFHVLTGKDRVLDNIVSEQNIDAAFTIFGPSRWRPKCFHLCGFAMAHIALPESPYWKLLSPISQLKSKLRIQLMKRDFKINNDLLWCENEYISERLRKIFKNKLVKTITNNYNQVFDCPDKWDSSIKLSPFNGITLLTISANYPHKNLTIALSVLEELKKKEPEINLRFVFTINRNQYPEIPDKFKDNFIFLGPISINQCPPLYQQADIMFQPSLLECFSATYAEAMKMNVPILTTDLGFAHSLCEDSALYYSATDYKDLANTIKKIAFNKSLSKVLVSNGNQQLKKFDSFESRTEKLIKILETNINNVNIQR